MADLSHMGVDTRMNIKKQVQTDIALLAYWWEKEEELSDFRLVYSGLSVSEIIHN